MLVARYDTTYQKAQSLYKHSEETASQAAQNLRALGLPHIGLLAGWLHDLEKRVPAWQAALEDVSNNIYRLARFERVFGCSSLPP